MLILALRRFKVLDAPGGRKQHVKAVPRTGGVAVLAGLAVGSAVGLAGGIEGLAGLDLSGTLPFLSATLVVFGVGLWDDIKGCSVLCKLLAQAVAALLFILGSPAIDFPAWPLGSVIAVAVAALWLMGVTNAVNFFDGLDGLAPGSGGLIAGSLAIIAASNGDQSSFMLAAVLSGACLGFLGYNWRPAKAFLGDSGSLTVGFTLGSLALVSSLRAETTIGLVAPPLLLAVPLIDAALVVVSRFRDRAQARLLGRLRRTTRGDRRHLHHRLLAAIGPGKAVLILYGMVAVSCLLAMMALYLENVSLAAVTLGLDVIGVAFLRGVRHRKLARALRARPASVRDRRRTALLPSEDVRVGRLPT